MFVCLSNDLIFPINKLCYWWILLGLFFSLIEFFTKYFSSLNTVLMILFFEIFLNKSVQSWAESQSSLLILIIRQSDQLQNKSRAESPRCWLPVFVECIWCGRKSPNISTQNLSRFQREGKIACLEKKWNNTILLIHFINPIFYAGKSDWRLDCESGVQSPGRGMIDLILDYYNSLPAWLIQPCHNKNIYYL